MRDSTQNHAYHGTDQYPGEWGKRKVWGRVAMLSDSFQEMTGIAHRERQPIGIQPLTQINMGI